MNLLQDFVFLSPFGQRNGEALCYDSLSFYFFEVLAMQILLWVVCFVSLLIAFVVGLGVSLGLINLWGLGVVAFFVLVLYTASTVLDKNYRDR